MKRPTSVEEGKESPIMNGVTITMVILVTVAYLLNILDILFGNWTRKR